MDTATAIRCAEIADAYAVEQEALAQKYVRSDRIFPVHRVASTIAKKIAADIRAALASATGSAT